MTGFENTIIIGIAIFTLIALLWRALGRHVTVNNTNSPSANATATSEPSGQGGTHRSIVGLLVSLGIIVAVIALAVAAFDLRASLSTSAPVIEKVITPTLAVNAVRAVPTVATTSIEIAAPYTPVELPAINTTLDLTPIVLLAIVATALVIISRRTSKPAEIKQVDPLVITHSEFGPLERFAADASDELGSADRPLQEVMNARK